MDERGGSALRSLTVIWMAMGVTEMLQETMVCLCLCYASAATIVAGLISLSSMERLRSNATLRGSKYSRAANASRSLVLSM